MKAPAVRAATGACAFLAAICFAAPAVAETPVDQCTDSGLSPSSPSASGTGFQPEPNFAMRPAVSTQPSLGSVNPRTGAFTYSNEDMALGAGEFPARLNLVRTYTSDKDGPTDSNVVPNTPYSPGSIQWYAYGRGATHNLDVTFREEDQSFGGQRYKMVVIRTGFQTETFQRCLDGQHRNTARNGSRLFADTTYGTGGYRYEASDGTVLLFQKMVAPSGPTGFTCEMVFTSSRLCGVLRRWTVPNGDWAEFEYQTYYSHPTNRAENGYTGTTTVWTYNVTLQECYPNFAGQSECHGVMYPNYYTTTAQQYPAILSYPVYDQRLTRVLNSRGYELRFQYLDPSVDPGGYCPAPSGTGLYCVTPGKNLSLERNRIASVTGHFVSPGQDTQLSQVSYGYANCMGNNVDCLSSVQTADGATTLINRAGWTLSIQLPGETAASTTVTFALAPQHYFYADRPRGYYTTNPRLTRQYFRVATQAFAGAGSVQYAPTFADRWVAEPYGMWARMPFVSTMQITEPGSAVTTLNYVDQYDEHGRPVSVTDPLSRTTSNSYNAVGALASTTLPEGQRIEYTYDLRGNLLTRTRYPSAGAESPLTETTAYLTGPTIDANACVNQRLCNRPSSRTDARGFQTDFAWDGTTGQLISETRPADPSGLHPMISYTYGTFLGANAGPIQLVASKTERIDAARNLVTNYGYGSTIRLPLREISLTDGSTTLRSCYAFDLIGNPISQTEPNAGLTSCP